MAQSYDCTYGVSFVGMLLFRWIDAAMPSRREVICLNPSILRVLESNKPSFCKCY